MFDDIWKLTNGVSRSISPENFTGAPGAGGRAVEGTGAHYARELGIGWKVSPSVIVEAGGQFVLGEIEGPGVIRHIWLTTHWQHWRSLLVKVFWDDEDLPGILSPLGDMFCNGWGEYSAVTSLPVSVNPHGGMNWYWPMPFSESARVEIENLGSEDAVAYYQIDYTLGVAVEDGLYLHSQWNRNNPLTETTDHVILDEVDSTGKYVGTYIAWGVNSSGWWGEGELKMYLDDDTAFPSICGTGTEDYFGGAWNFDVPGEGYTVYSGPFLGLNQVLRPDGQYRSQQRFGMYRWHMLDPVVFERRARVTIQALGWRGNGKDRRYLPLHDDIASTAWWYQANPRGVERPAPTIDELEVL